MKPIIIKKVALNMSNINELEYKYLIEVPKDIRDKYERYCGNYMDGEVDNNKLLELFTDNDFNTYRYLGKIGDSNLFIYEGSLYTSNQDEDFLYFGNGWSNDGFGFIITDEVLKDMVGKRLNFDWRGNDSIREILEKYKGKEICIGDFIQRFLAYGLKKQAENDRIAKIREIERIEAVKGNELEIKEFCNGEWKVDNDTYGRKNIIYYNDGEYTFNKDFNKLFTIEELNGSKNSYSSYGANLLNWIEMLSVKLNVSYKFVSKDKLRTYNVKFKKETMYVDDVCVPKGRSVFFISRASGDKKKLEVLKELSAIKVEFLALTKISLRTDSYVYDNIPIEVKYADKLWEVTFMDKTIKRDWKGLEMFRYNIQSLKNQFYTSDINDMREMFGISKADLFDFMKKTQLLDKLGEED